MGMDVYAKTAIGFEVSEEDFIITITGPVQCKRGHAAPSTGARFCEHDGTPFAPTLDIDFTPAMHALVQFETDPDDPNMPDLESLYHDGDFLHDINTDSYDDRPTRICGVMVHESKSHENAAPEALPWEDVQEAFEKVVQIREALGFQDRPIQMFSWMYVSV